MESRCQRGPVNFPSERAVYVQYIHPEDNSKQLSQDKKKQKKTPTRPTRMSLIFALNDVDVDVDDANSVLTGGSFKSAKSTKSAESASFGKHTSVKTALKHSTTPSAKATLPVKQSPTKKGNPTKVTASSTDEVTAYNIEKAHARLASERAAVVARLAMSAHPTEDPTKIFSSMYAIQYDKFDFPYHSVYVKADLKVLTPATLAEAMQLARTTRS